MKNNKGFSLIEVVVVIALLGIVTFLSVNMMASANRSKARQFASNVKNAIDEMKSDGTSKAGRYALTITKSGNDIIATEYKVSDSGVYTAIDQEVIAKGSNYTLKEGASGSYSLGTNFIAFEFNKGDGSFDMANWCTGDITSSYGVVGEVEELVMSYKTNSKRVYVSKITGKYYMDK